MQLVTPRRLSVARSSAICSASWAGQLLTKVTDIHMARKQETFVARANESLQENLDANEPVIFASYGVIGAIFAFGGAGYLLDRWLGTGPWCLVTGLLVGLTVGLIVVVTAVRRSRQQHG